MALEEVENLGRQQIAQLQREHSGKTFVSGLATRMDICHALGKAHGDLAFELRNIARSGGLDTPKGV